MKINSFGITEGGTAHAENEDVILIDKSSNLYAVADGITLPYGGRIASDKAVLYLKSFFDGKLVKAFETLNKKICDEKEIDSSIGSTNLTAIYIKDNNLEVAHVGDTSAYLVRAGGIKLITCPDSVPGTSIVTQAIGINGINIHRYKEKLCKGDFILLVSDGVTNVLTKEELVSIVNKYKDVKKIAESIILTAREKPKIYDDDRSIVIISI